MTGQLHLPDLPDVAVAVPAPGAPPPGGAPARTPFLQRARTIAAGYLPLVLMTLLALGTWIVAKNSPGLLAPSTPGDVRHEPDYTLDHFTLQRFDPTGALNVEIEGDHMQHFPDDDTMEVERIRVVSTETDGGKMTATALQGRANGDGSEVWLDGQAQVVSEAPGQVPIKMNGEHLRAQPKAKLVESDSPVIVQQAGSQFRAEGLLYDHNTRILTLRGKSNALLQPALRSAAARKP